MIGLGTGLQAAAVAVLLIVGLAAIWAVLHNARKRGQTDARTAELTKAMRDHATARRTQDEVDALGDGAVDAELRRKFTRWN